MDEVNAMTAEGGSALNAAKRTLAYTLTAQVHGEEEAKKAQQAAEALFGGGGSLENIPTVALTPADVEATGLRVVEDVYKRQHRDALRKLGGRIIQRAFHGDRGLSAAGFAIFKPGYIERDGLADERIRHSERRTGEALACSGLDRGACSGEKFAAFIEDPDIRHRGGAVVMDGEGKRHVAGNLSLIHI